MRTVRAVATALLGAVALTGCGAAGAQPPAPGPPAAASNAPTPAGPAPSEPVVPATPGGPTGPSTAASAGPSTGASAGPSTAAGRLVAVTRSGGFAGRTTGLLVTDDGSWTRLDGEGRRTGSGKLSADGLARLRAALAAADFPRLPRVPTGGPTVYDGFTYAFVHGGREVTARDGAIPPGLADVLSALPSFEGS
ncbi:hypothetical protein ACFV2Q_13795 [Streptomyces sp. NPDC059650]|uniref:hypothetical protein n=1 Tax=Streptomyces sp. NPDC059650 TaxID=3346896 RepID=UPI0036B4507A